MVRFVAHFMSKLDNAQDDGLQFLPLLEFDVAEADEADQVDDDEDDDLAEGAAA